MRWMVALMVVSGLLGVVMMPLVAQARQNPVSLTKTWKGSVPDAGLKKDVPEVITSGRELEAVWKKWKIAGEVPQVDFTKQIVVLGTTSGSNISLSARLDDKGNLQVIGIATADFGEGFRYVLGTVSREGVKTVNKKDLPK